jgi:hypothetical protein
MHKIIKFSEKFFKLEVEVNESLVNLRTIIHNELSLITSKDDIDIN